MKFNLSIRYQTHWGESVFLCLERKNISNEDRFLEIELEYRNTEEWGKVLDLDDVLSNADTFYFYRIRKNKAILKEDRSHRFFPISDASIGAFHEIVIIDEWNDMMIPHNVYHKSYFSRLQEQSPIVSMVCNPSAATPYQFVVTTHHLAPGKKIGILGSSKELHFWDVKRPLMLEQHGNRWHLEMQFDTTGPIQYKYVICDDATGELIAFEKGNNRIIDLNSHHEKAVIWNQFADFSVYAWKGTGLNVPLSGLRSKKDWGIGDFSTLSLFLDWLKVSGFSILQLLPINDTMSLSGKRDSYPYSAISAFAIHPVYLDIKALAQKYDYEIDAEILAEANTLNQLPTLDHVDVVELKMDVLRKIYSSIPENKFDTEGLNAFEKNNKEWLLPYAAFSALRDDFETADHSLWHSYRKYHREEIEAIWISEGKMKMDMSFYVFLQFEIYEQFQKVKDKANMHGIALKGDLPIGVGRNSVETWTRPELFHMDEQAGAPPDAFSRKGQNWFFPTYNWEEMDKDNYRWWTSRMQQLQCYFDAIRLDHILGFFRIWSIPISCREGLMGRFVPAKGFSHEEILSWGLEKGIHQLTQPYFTDELLKIKFGDVWKEIKIEFLDEQGFRNEYNRQEDLIAFVAANEKWKPLQDQLLELQSDLIFLKDPQNPEVLHFRINMMETDCFKSLSWSDQQVLREKYYAYFFKDQYASWKADGTKKLNQLQHATSMLICAEDLGMVPDFVEGVLQEKEMLVLQVQRMPKKMGMTFSRPTEASYLSVVTPSTHDMSPLRSWWLEDRALTHKFYHEVMHGVGNEPELCSEEVVRWIINEHLRAPSMWSIFLLQDILSLDEKWWNPDLVSDRINNPADPFHYWNYRMHVSIESLLDDTTFSGSIHKMIAESGRGL